MGGLRDKIKLNSRRVRYRLRAFRKAAELSRVRFRADDLGQEDILLFCTLRNEQPRLAFFLEYYRKLGVNHFFFVDNFSTDGTIEYLAEQPDVSLWRAEGSYKHARFGMDWLNFLLRRFGSGHWCLTVDPDEFLTFPHDDHRSLRDLTNWLASRRLCAFPAMLLDMYGDGPIEAAFIEEGRDPFDVLQWFDAGSYSYKPNSYFGNIWIQGGPRQRLYFADSPQDAPSLNKIPLVFWNWRYVYASSTHMLLPTRVNRSVWAQSGADRPSGVLRHAKFVAALTQKAAEEMERKQHFARSREYASYLEGTAESPMTPQSSQYTGWRQLEALGLISRGGWL
ncbi:glycosyltransferase family 2 protein [Paracoccaceae bacterium GXU_MW_L88]